MIIELPFPPKELSPNASVHWRTSGPKKKRQRADAYVVTQAAYRPFAEDWDKSSRIRLDFTFYPPHNRAYDRDNLIARMKAAIDGIADGLGVNDKVFDIGTIDIGPKVPSGNVRVHITTVSASENLISERPL